MIVSVTAVFQPMFVYNGQDILYKEHSRYKELDKDIEIRTQQSDK